MPSNTAPIRIPAALALASLLAGCAGERAREPVAAEVVEEDPEAVILLDPDDPYAYRFDMEQEGVRMTADDFDAWMKRHGMKISKGAPAPALPDPPPALPEPPAD